MFVKNLVMKNKIVLGIETSCDETAVGIVNAGGEILANVVLSQYDDHKAFGGVVPEIAARAHVDHIDALIAQAMKEASLEFDDLDGVAATCGPGLIGGVMVGMMAGKAIAFAHNKPFLAINHLEGHALTPRLSDQVPFPYLLLLVSGGHTQLLIVKGVGDYEELGTTIDDALGECFDKSAKMMGLPHPGGPHLEKLALEATSTYIYDLPKPLIHDKDCRFSFSGLKTAVLRQIEAMEGEKLPRDQVADLAASFQDTIADILKVKCGRAIDIYMETTKTETPGFVVSGGVAANKVLRKALAELAIEKNISFATPPIPLCTDNGVMIAWAGVEKLTKNMVDNLDHPAKPRWSLKQSA